MACHVKNTSNVTPYVYRWRVQLTDTSLGFEWRLTIWISHKTFEVSRTEREVKKQFRNHLQNSNIF